MTTAIDGPTTLSPAPADDAMAPISLALRVQSMRPPGVDASARDPAPGSSPQPETGSDEGQDKVDPSEAWQKLFNTLMVMEWFDGWLDRTEATVDNGDGDS
ncbi:hypothetical protein [Pandoraea anhela]|uniref:Uncharacterized protein n=1 Tax=Pandoraea anhela TaxID=2508295 RepID=A0A5E4SP47_9BURK|nr:hypothetical protein [Pandoraea anhela]VVD77460.1 hypothetical protein PAN31108_00932 [Pandoraea anhela]